MTDLNDLLARVEKATKASEELDTLILCAVAGPPGAFVERSRFNGAWCIYTAPGKAWEARDWWRPGGWPLTASVDAALALVERALPANHGVTLYIRETTLAEIFTTEDDSFRGHCKTPPLAILSSLLHALKDKTNG